MTQEALALALMLVLALMAAALALMLVSTNDVTLAFRQSMWLCFDRRGGWRRAMNDAPGGRATTNDALILRGAIWMASCD